MIKCINCSSQNLKKIISLGNQPLSGVFKKKKNKYLKKYSLELFECKKCKLVQLGDLIKNELMFGKQYEYSTSLSNLMKTHIKLKFLKLKKNKLINSNSKILDIGSNDGFFLNNFSSRNTLYGIDPSAEKFKHNYKTNIKLIIDFFFKEKILQYDKKIKFDLITSFAMFYDVKNPNLFCKDINHLLSKNGIWMLELSYLPLMLKNLTYDQICHEHIAYYSLTTFKNLIEKHNLKIIDVSLNEINGGSIEIICSKKSSSHIIKKNKISKILKDEKKINKFSYHNFNKRIKNVKKIFQLFLNLNSKKKIIGYGASTKANVVLNYCEVKNSQIKEICDGSWRKVGMFTPGTNIKIISKLEMRKKKPDYLIVFIWSFRKEVIKQEKLFLLNGGKLIFLLPKFHIISKDNYEKYINTGFKDMSYKY